MHNKAGDVVDSKIDITQPKLLLILIWATLIKILKTTLNDEIIFKEVYLIKKIKNFKIKTIGII